MSNKIEPINVDQCQTEIKEGSFMTLGPRTVKQCPNKPTHIAIEKKTADDGLIGAMSLCDNCVKNMKKIMGENFAHIFEIKRNE